jgi:hypothetical protein
LEDGVEERNTLSFNLAALIHFIGNPALGQASIIAVVEESPDLRLPADITASGFYITNMHNFLIGNSASGGWAGFAFPVFDKPTGPHKDDDYSPKQKPSLVIDGNTGMSLPANFLPVSKPSTYKILSILFSPFQFLFLGLCSRILFRRSSLLQLKRSSRVQRWEKYQ